MTAPVDELTNLELVQEVHRRLMETEVQRTQDLATELMTRFKIGELTP